MSDFRRSCNDSGRCTEKGRAIPGFCRCAEDAAKIELLRAAAKQAETIMMIVEPRSHKAKYLKALSGLRNALEG